MKAGEGSESGSGDDEPESLRALEIFSITAATGLLNKGALLEEVLYVCKSGTGDAGSEAREDIVVVEELLEEVSSISSDDSEISTFRMGELPVLEGESFSCKAVVGGVNDIENGEKCMGEVGINCCERLDLLDDEGREFFEGKGKSSVNN